MNRQGARSPFFWAMIAVLLGAFVASGCNDDSDSGGGNDDNDSDSDTTEPLNWTGRYVTEGNLAWASRRNLTSSQFSDSFEHYRDLGYIIINTGAKSHGSSARYSMVWRENVDGRGWAQYRNMTSDQYHEKWNEMKDQGYRPLDVEGYLIDGELRFSGIWIENVEGISWSSRRNMTSDQYSEYFEEQREAGRRPIDIEIYETGSGPRIAAIWYENVDGLAWAQFRNMTRESYLQEVEERAEAGYRMIDFESYELPNGQYYAAIWERPREDYAYQIRTDRSSLGYANLWRQYADEGYRVVDLEHYDTPSGERFGGIWIENNDRFRYSRKQQLNDAIQQYRSDEDLPGISVAIIQDGDVIYRRGFGDADVAGGKVAHSRTVYNSASVAKVIGGTLAVRMEDSGVLRDGTTVNLNLSNLTSDYLTNIEIADENGTGTEMVSIPAFHSHQVDQLAAHIACIGHYSTSPAIPNQTDHYVSSSQAANSIWDTGLLDGCTIGQSRSYSTAAFTLFGAVLEQVADRSISELLDEELRQGFGLSSLRAQFANETLPANYERAVPYTNSNNETSYQDNSWKVLGGGIEINPLDLARFGWLTLNGDIVDADARDDRLWSPVDPGCSGPGGGTCMNGVAWRLRTVGGRNVAEHGGSWTGARSHLRVYRDDGLVIAVMSNRTSHSPASLVTELADIVLN